MGGEDRLRISMRHRCASCGHRACDDGASSRRSDGRGVDESRHSSTALAVGPGCHAARRIRRPLRCADLSWTPPRGDPVRSGRSDRAARHPNTRTGRGSTCLPAICCWTHGSPTPTAIPTTGVSYRRRAAPSHWPPASITGPLWLAVTARRGRVNRNGLRGAMTPQMRQEAQALAAHPVSHCYPRAAMPYSSPKPTGSSPMSKSISRTLERSGSGEAPIVIEDPLNCETARLRSWKFSDLRRHPRSRRCMGV